MELLQAVQATQNVEERIALLRLLKTTTRSKPSDARNFSQTFTELWRSSHPSQEPDYRLEIAAAARSQIPTSEADAGVLLDYAFLASEACAWSAIIPESKRISVDKAHLATFELVSAVLSALLSGPHPCPGVLSTLLQNFFSFVKAACISQDAQPSEKELVKAAFETIHLSVKLGVDILQRPSERFEKARIFTVIRCLLEGLVIIGTQTTGSAAMGLVSMSWKSVVSTLDLLSQKDGSFEEFNISSMITTLLSLASNTLLTNSTSRKQQMKFFIVHAIRICQAFPREAVKVHRGISAFCITISALLLKLDDAHPQGSLLQNKDVLKDEISDAVAPVSLALLHTLFISEDIELHAKGEFLDYLTTTQRSCKEKVVELLGTDYYTSAARVSVFIYLLQVSAAFSKDTLGLLTSSLDWLLGILSDMPQYRMVLQENILVSTKEQPVCQLLYLSILQALETLVMVAKKLECETILKEVEEFLFRNILHDFSVCRELVLDLWSFMFKNGNEKLWKAHLQALFLLFQEVSFVIRSGSAYHDVLKCFTRLICALAKFVPGSVLSWFIGMVFKDYSCADILVEDGLHVPKSIALQHLHGLFNLVSSDGTGLQKEAFYLLLDLSSQCRALDKEFSDKIANLARGAIENSVGDARALSRALICMSVFKLSESSIEKLLTTLKTLLPTFETMAEVKVSLAEFLSYLYDVPFREEYSDPKSEAVWNLYEFVLRQRHWALVNAGLASFGEFAAKTSCNELWRFVPSDAPLSFGPNGVDTIEDGFMSALRVFLEKQTDNTTLQVTKSELDFLKEEMDLQKALQLRKLENYAKMRKEQSIPLDQMSSQPPSNNERKMPAAPEQIASGLSKIREGILILKASEWKGEEQNASLSELISELVTFQEAVMHQKTMIS